MTSQQIALVAHTDRLSTKELEKVAGALQKQIDRDFRPVWEIAARVQPFSKADVVPSEFWPVNVRDRIEPEGAWSIHSVKDGRPFAEVTFGENWTLGASHDLLEMLVDPNVKRVSRAPSIREGENHDVEYLVQVCDPCASLEHAYKIDGVLVADFTTPAYWTGRGNHTGKRRKYSFRGKLQRPLQVLRGGYLSWRDPKTHRWWQKVWWGDEPEFRNLGTFEPATSEKGKRRSVRATQGRRIHFELVMLKDVYRAQEPRVQSIRKTVEDLIRLFG